MEIFKNIDELQDYQVSNLGRVQRLRKDKWIDCAQFFIAGYFIVALRVSDHKYKNFLVHRLMANAFLEKPQATKKLIVRHLNDNPKNNVITNLAWGTVKDNYWDYYRNQGKRTFQKLTEQQVIEIRKLRESTKMFYKDIAKIYGVCATTIGCICRREYYNDIN
jgi:predicted RNA-binding protein